MVTHKNKYCIAVGHLRNELHQGRNIIMDGFCIILNRRFLQKHRSMKGKAVRFTVQSAPVPDKGIGTIKRVMGGLGNEKQCTWPPTLLFNILSGKIQRIL